MTDHIDRAAEVLSRHWGDMHTNEALGHQRMLARALDAAGLLAAPRHDAQVAARALRGAAAMTDTVKVHAGGGNLVADARVVLTGQIIALAEHYEREAGESDAER